ncbi:MAG TPA: hypothetical protein VHR47_12485 [Bacillota bacterium]|nr:hypothetical protein [Bacillota bacterium]
MLFPDQIPQEVVLPISLYKSLQGKYFVGYADNVDAAPPGVTPGPVYLIRPTRGKYSMSMSSP